ncbi:MAG: methylmalonyl-CoA epimerase [Byssovorax sp.]
MKIKKIAHVALAVSDMDQTLGKLKQVLGIDPMSHGFVPSQHVDAALLPIGETCIEVVSPKGNEGVQRFVDKRGAALHHVALEVEGLDEALATLRAAGVALIDQEPRLGAHGFRVAFIHPKATGGLLIELVEPTGAPMSGPGDPQGGPIGTF